MTATAAPDRGNLDLPLKPDTDPDEIVIMGDAEKRQRARYGLAVGLDRLSACSRIVWDDLTRQLRLRCAPATPVVTNDTIFRRSRNPPATG